MRMSTVPYSDPWRAAELLTPVNTPGPAFKLLLLDGGQFTQTWIPDYFRLHLARAACRKLEEAFLSLPYSAVVSTVSVKWSRNARLNSAPQVMQALKKAFLRIYKSGLLDLRPSDAGVWATCI